MGMRGRIREFFGLEGNLLPIVLSELSSNVGWNMFGVIWQPYVLSMGASVSILRALDSLRVALMSVLQPLMGRLSDSFGARAQKIFEMLAPYTYIPPYIVSNLFREKTHRENQINGSKAMGTG